MTTPRSLNDMLQELPGQLITLRNAADKIIVASNAAGDEVEEGGTGQSSLMEIAKTAASMSQIFDSLLIDCAPLVVGGAVKPSDPAKDAHEGGDLSQTITHLEQALERFKKAYAAATSRAVQAEKEYEQAREQIGFKDEALTALRAKVTAQNALIASAKRLLSKEAPDGVAMGLEDPSKLA